MTGSKDRSSLRSKQRLKTQTADCEESLSGTESPSVSRSQSRETDKGKRRAPNSAPQVRSNAGAKRQKVTLSPKGEGSSSQDVKVQNSPSKLRSGQGRRSVGSFSPSKKRLASPRWKQLKSKSKSEVNLCQRRGTALTNEMKRLTTTSGFWSTKSSRRSETPVAKNSDAISKEKTSDSETPKSSLIDRSRSANSEPKRKTVMTELRRLETTDGFLYPDHVQGPRSIVKTSREGSPSSISSVERVAPQEKKPRKDNLSVKEHDAAGDVDKGATFETGASGLPRRNISSADRQSKVKSTPGSNKPVSSDVSVEKKQNKRRSTTVKNEESSEITPNHSHQLGKSARSLKKSATNVGEDDDALSVASSTTNDETPRRRSTKRSTVSDNHSKDPERPPDSQADVDDPNSNPEFFISDLLGTRELKRLNTTSGFWAPTPDIGTVLGSKATKRSTGRISTQSRLLQHRKKKLHSIRSLRKAAQANADTSTSLSTSMLKSKKKALKVKAKLGRKSKQEKLVSNNEGFNTSYPLESNNKHTTETTDDNTNVVPVFSSPQMEPDGEEKSVSIVIDRLPTLDTAEPFQDKKVTVKKTWQRGRKKKNWRFLQRHDPSSGSNIRPSLSQDPLKTATISDSATPVFKKTWRRGRKKLSERIKLPEAVLASRRASLRAADESLKVMQKIEAETKGYVTKGTGLSASEDKNVKEATIKISVNIDGCQSILPFSECQSSQMAATEISALDSDLSDSKPSALEDPSHSDTKEPAGSVEEKLLDSLESADLVEPKSTYDCISDIDSNQPTELRKSGIPETSGLATMKIEGSGGKISILKGFIMPGEQSQPATEEVPPVVEQRSETQTVVAIEKSSSNANNTSVNGDEKKSSSSLLMEDIQATSSTSLVRGINEMSGAMEIKLDGDTAATSISQIESEHSTSSVASTGEPKENHHHEQSKKKLNYSVGKTPSLAVTEVLSDGTGREKDQDRDVSNTLNVELRGQLISEQQNSQIGNVESGQDALSESSLKSIPKRGKKKKKKGAWQRGVMRTDLWKKRKAKMLAQNLKMSRKEELKPEALKPVQSEQGKKEDETLGKTEEQKLEIIESGQSEKTVEENEEISHKDVLKPETVEIGPPVQTQQLELASDQSVQVLEKVSGLAEQTKESQIVSYHVEEKEESPLKSNNIDQTLLSIESSRASSRASEAGSSMSLPVLEPLSEQASEGSSQSDKSALVVEDGMQSKTNKDTSSTEETNKKQQGGYRNLKKTTLLKRLKTDANFAVTDDTPRGRRTKETAAENIQRRRQKLRAILSEVRRSRSQELTIDIPQEAERPKSLTSGSLPSLTPTDTEAPELNQNSPIDNLPPTLSPQVDNANSRGYRFDLSETQDVVQEGVDEDLHLYWSGVSDEELGSPSKSITVSPIKVPFFHSVPTLSALAAKALHKVSAVLSDIQKASPPQAHLSKNLSSSNLTDHSLEKKKGRPPKKIKGKRGRPPGVPMSKGDAYFKEPKVSPTGLPTRRALHRFSGFTADVESGRKFEFRKKSTRSPIAMLEMKRRQEEAIYDLEEERRRLRREHLREKRNARITPGELEAESPESDCIDGDIRPCAVILNDFVKRLQLSGESLPEVGAVESEDESGAESPEEMSDDEDWCADLEDLQDAEDEEWAVSGKSESRPYIPRLKIKRVVKKGPKFLIKRSQESSGTDSESHSPIKLIIKTEPVSEGDPNGRTTVSTLTTPQPVDLENLNSSGFEGSFVDFLKTKKAETLKKSARVVSKAKDMTPGGQSLTPVSTETATAATAFSKNSGEEVTSAQKWAQSVSGVSKQKHTVSDSAADDDDILILDLDDSTAEHPHQDSSSDHGQTVSKDNMSSADKGINKTLSSDEMNLMKLSYTADDQHTRHQTSKETGTEDNDSRPSFCAEQVTASRHIDVAQSSTEEVVVKTFDLSQINAVHKELAVSVNTPGVHKVSDEASEKVKDTNQNQALLTMPATDLSNSQENTTLVLDLSSDQSSKTNSSSISTQMVSSEPISEAQGKSSEAGEVGVERQSSLISTFDSKDRTTDDTNVHSSNENVEGKENTDSVVTGEPNSVVTDSGDYATDNNNVSATSKLAPTGDSPSKGSPVSKSVSPKSFVPSGQESDQWKRKHIQQCDKVPSGLFACKRCTFTASTRLMIESHIYSHIPGVQFRCSYCESEFSSMAATSTHLKNTHPLKETKFHISRRIDEQNFYEVKESAERLSGADTSPSQNQTAQASPGGQSPPFVISVVVSGGVNSSRGGRTSLSTRRYVCTHCGFSTNVRANADQHVSDLHTANSVYTCVLCDENICYSESEIKHHSATVHPTRTKPYRKLPDFYDAELLSTKRKSLGQEQAPGAILLNLPSEDADQEAGAVDHRQRAKEYLYLCEGWKEKTSAEADSTTAVDYTEDGVTESSEAAAHSDPSSVEHISSEVNFDNLDDSVQDRVSTDEGTVDTSSSITPLSPSEDIVKESPTKVKDLIESTSPQIKPTSNKATDHADQELLSVNSETAVISTSVPTEATETNCTSLESRDHKEMDQTNLSSVTETDTAALKPAGQTEQAVSKSVPEEAAHSSKKSIEVMEETQKEVVQQDACSNLKITEVVSLSEKAGQSSPSSATEHIRPEEETTMPSCSGESTSESELSVKTKPGMVSATSASEAAVIKDSSPSSAPPSVIQSNPAVATANSNSSTSTSTLASKPLSTAAPAATPSTPTATPSTPATSASSSLGRLPLSYKCSGCKVHTPYLLMMVKHLKAKHPHIPCFACPYCKSTIYFSSQKQLRVHVKNLHPDKLERNEISLSEDAKKLVEAMVLPHSAECTRVGNRLVLEEDIHTCTYCQVKMTSLANVYEHLNETHSDLFEFVCPVCQTFKDKSLAEVANHCMEVHKSPVDKDKVHVSVPKNLFSVLTCISKHGKYIEKNLDNESENKSSTANTSSESNQKATPEESDKGNQTEKAVPAPTTSTPISSISSQQEAPPVLSSGKTKKSGLKAPLVAEPCSSQASAVGISGVPIAVITQTPLLAIPFQPSSQSQTQRSVPFSSSLFDTSSMLQPQTSLISTPQPLHNVPYVATAAATSFLSPKQPPVIAKSSHGTKHVDKSIAHRNLPVLNVPKISPRPSMSSPTVSPAPQSRRSLSPHGSFKPQTVTTAEAPPSPTDMEEEPKPEDFKIFNLKPAAPILPNPAIPTVFPPVSGPSFPGGFIHGAAAGFPQGMMLHPGILPHQFSGFAQAQLMPQTLSQSPGLRPALRPTDPQISSSAIRQMQQQKALQLKQQQQNELLLKQQKELQLKHQKELQLKQQKELQLKQQKELQLKEFQLKQQQQQQKEFQLKQQQQLTHQQLEMQRHRMLLKQRQQQQALMKQAMWQKVQQAAVVSNQGPITPSPLSSQRVELSPHQSAGHTSPGPSRLQPSPSLTSTNAQSMGQTFTAQSQARPGMKGQHKRSSHLYQCPYCPNVVTMKAIEVPSHIQQHHPGSQVQFKRIG